MIKWIDFYTNPKLSQLIKEKKGILPDDSEYWKSPLTLGWLDAEDDSSFIPYPTFRMYQTNERDFVPFLSPSEIDKKNNSFIPAYHILQDICVQYWNLFFNDCWGANRIKEEFTRDINRNGILQIEKRIKDFLSYKRLDGKEA